MAFVNITPCENTTVQYLHFTSLTVQLRNVGHDGEVQPATRRVTRSTSGAFDTFYESLSLLMSPTRKSASALLNNLLSPRRSCSLLRRLRFFGHIIPSDSDEDHTRALKAGINDPPKEWKRPRGRPRQTWLHTIENDLNHQNLGLWSARHRAYDRDLWRDIVETATFLHAAC